MVRSSMLFRCPYRADIKPRGFYFPGRCPGLLCLALTGHFYNEEYSKTRTSLLFLQFLFTLLHCLGTDFAASPPFCIIKRFLVDKENEPLRFDQSQSFERMSMPLSSKTVSFIVSDPLPFHARHRVTRLTFQLITNMANATTSLSLKL